MKKLEKEKLNFIKSMPEAFEKCIKAGGKVKRKRIDATHWMNFCIPPGGGKGDSIGGEVHEYKKLTKKK